MRQHVLDANALLNFLTGRPGADQVAQVFKQAKAAEIGTVMMSVIAWGEVYYTLAKSKGLASATKTLAEVRERSGLHLVRVDDRDALKAAALKARYGIPYADAFTAALTGSQHVVVTADVEHFSLIPKIRILKLPAHKKN